MVKALRLFFNNFVTLAVGVTIGLLVTSLILGVFIGVFWVAVKVSFILGAALIILIGALITTVTELRSDRAREKEIERMKEEY